MRPFDLVGVVNRTVEAVRHGKQVQVDVPAATPVVIGGDPSRMQQVVWNPVSNALKFTPSGGKVLVDMWALDDQAELRVVDNGMGIPAGFLPFVFAKFRQADASFTRQHGGLGLGLANGDHLIEPHGGTIERFRFGCSAGLQVCLTRRT